MRRLNTTFISINNIMMIIYNTESLPLVRVKDIDTTKTQLKNERNK